MPILIARREDPKRPDSHFIIRIKGAGDVSEKAACIDEAIGALARKNPSKFRRLVQEIRVRLTEEGYFAYIRNWRADAYGLGDCHNSAVGALIRLNPHDFKTLIILRGETNGPRKPR